MLRSARQYAATSSKSLRRMASATIHADVVTWPVKIGMIGLVEDKLEVEAFRLSEYTGTAVPHPGSISTDRSDGYAPESAPLGRVATVG